MLKQNRTVLFHYVLIAAVSAVFLFFFGHNTSPFLRYIGPDSGIFLIIGRSMARGTPLYTTLFDHKGPIIFLLNALGHLLTPDGLTGVWLLTLLCMTISAWMLYHTATQHLDAGSALTVPFFYIWSTVCMFNGGNYTEEYANFFSVLALALFDRWQRSGNLPSVTPYLLGVGVGFTFFLRPNNAAILAAVVVYIGLTMLLSRKKGILRALLFGLLGILTVALPLIFYHSLHGTLHEMLQATVLHNLQYCAKADYDFQLLPNGNNAEIAVFLIIVLLNVIGSFVCFVRGDRKNAAFILLGAIITTAAILVSRHPFLYYWTLLTPLSAYSVIFLLKYRRNPSSAGVQRLVAAILLVVFFCSSLACTQMSRRKQSTEQLEIAAQLYAQIPDAEKDDCFAFDMPAPILYTLDIPLPCKYFVMQPWMAQTDPQIMHTCIDYVAQAQPKWLISFYPLTPELTWSSLAQLVAEQYTLVFENECGLLYRINE